MRGIWGNETPYNRRKDRWRIVQGPLSQLFTIVHCTLFIQNSARHHHIYLCLCFGHTVPQVVVTKTAAHTSQMKQPECQVPSKASTHSSPPPIFPPHPEQVAPYREPKQSAQNSRLFSILKPSPGERERERGMSTDVWQYNTSRRHNVHLLNTLIFKFKCCLCNWLCSVDEIPVVGLLMHSKCEPLLLRKTNKLS